MARHRAEGFERTEDCEDVACAHLAVGQIIGVYSLQFAAVESEYIGRVLGSRHGNQRQAVFTIQPQ